MRQHPAVEGHGRSRSACSLALALIGLAAGGAACGGRTLDADGLPGGGGAGQGGAASSNGNGNNGNGSNGNGSNGNANNGNANNGATTDTGNLSSAEAVTAVTVSSNGASTTGNPGAPGTCDEPYDLNALGGRFSGVTSGSSAFNGSCNGMGPEIFFTWEAPRRAGYRLHTSGSTIDTVLYRLNRGGCEARVDDCSDDANGFATSELLFSAERGERMTFVLDSYYAAGAVQLAVEETDLPPCGPVSDELFGVGSLVNQALPLDETTLGDTTTDACEGGPPRISFDWTAPSDGVFTFDTVGSNYDTVLVVRTICDIMAGENCNDDEFGVQSGLVQEVKEGQVLRIEVAAFGGSANPMGDMPWVALNVRE